MVTIVQAIADIPRILALPSASSLAAALAVALVDGCSALSATLHGSMRRFLPTLNCFEVILERAALLLERGVVGIYV